MEALSLQPCHHYGLGFPGPRPGHSNRLTTAWSLSAMGNQKTGIAAVASAPGDSMGFMSFSSFLFYVSSRMKNRGSLGTWAYVVQGLGAAVKLPFQGIHGSGILSTQPRTSP